MAALVFVSIALCQTSADAASPWTRGCVVWTVECACLTPSFCRYQFTLLGEQWHMYVNNYPRVVT